MSAAKLRVLIIDDEELICWSLAEELEKEGYQVSMAHTGEDGIEVFKDKSPDVVLLDNRLPGMDGLSVLKEIRDVQPTAIVILMTAYGTIGTAVEAMKKGAYEYVNKPIEFEEVKITISKALEANNIEREIAELRRKLKEKYGFSNIIANSPVMQEVFEMTHKVAHSEAMMVLLQGESGTGKDLIAKAIHYESRRSEKPFVVINCAALPETLLESELFGYEKGAFTDAKQQKKGQLELADGGTIFLDEIGELSQAMQVKLLRLLESRSFVRVGGTSEIHIDVRFIAATNRDLLAALKDGSFRQDIYYRLNVIHIWIPPLRERREDVPSLIRYFINRYNTEFCKKFSGIEPEAEKALINYSWNGNVRELRNVIERVMILENEPKILLEHLPPEITQKYADFDNVLQSIRSIPEEGISLVEIEKRLIQLALNKTHGNKTKAADLLSVSRDTLRYKIKKYNSDLKTD